MMSPVPVACSAIAFNSLSVNFPTAFGDIEKFLPLIVLLMLLGDLIETVDSLKDDVAEVVAEAENGIDKTSDAAMIEVRILF